MSYGLLSVKMLETIRPLVAGKTVVDLGAGSCDKAVILKGLGAAVIAIDKSFMRPIEGIEQHCGYFVEFADLDDRTLPEEIDVAFVSWPQNYRLNGLVRILERAGTVIYLGSNTDGNACGHRDLFLHMLTRKLEAYVPDRKNSLVVVGEALGRMRKPTFEEKAGLSTHLLRFRS